MGSRRIIIELVCVALGLMLLASPSIAQDTQPASTQPADAASTQPVPTESTSAAAQATAPAATVRLQYANQPIGVVVRHVSQMLDKPLLGDFNVQGTISFVDSRAYTPEEAFEIVNILLAMRGYRLVEDDTGRFLMLRQLSEIPSMALPILKWPSDFQGLRDQDLVQVLLPLQYINAEEASRAVVRMVSPFGSLAPLPQSRGVLITDTVENVRRIQALLEMLDTDQAVGDDLALSSIELASAPARGVAEVIGRLYGPESIGRPMRWDEKNNRYVPAPISPADVVAATFDERTNTLFLRGVPELLARAEEMARTLDETDDPSADIRTYTFENADVAEVARIVNEALPQPQRGQPRARVVANEAGNQLIVSGPIEQMAAIDRLVQDIEQSPARSEDTRIFELAHSDARQLAQVVQYATRRLDSRRRPYNTLNVVPEPQGNRLIVSGPSSEIETAAALIAQIDQPAEAGDREIRVIQLSSGDVRYVARALARVMEESGSGSAQIDSDPTSNSLIIAAAAGDWPMIEQMLQQWQAQVDQQAAPSTRMFMIENATAGEIAQTLNSLYNYRNRYRSRSDVPVLITANERSNSILVSAAQQDLEEIAQLIDTMDVADAGEDQLVIFQLQAANAGDVAQALQQTLPRPRPGQRTQVSLSIDATTNSVLVRAPESLRQEIADVIAQLDQSTVTQAARETRIVRVENAAASSLAQVLNDLFRSQAPIDRWGRTMPQPADERVFLTAAPGDRALVIDAPAAKMNEVVELIGTFDSSESGIASAELLPRTYTLEHAVAYELARSLQRLFAQQRGQRDTGEPEPRFEAEMNSNQLLVSATESQFALIDQLIQQMESAAQAQRTQVRLFELENARASNLVQPVTSIVQTDMASLQVSTRRGRWDYQVSADENSNTLIVTALPSTLDKIAQLLPELDVAEGDTVVTELVELQSANAEELAQVLNAAVTSQGGRTMSGQYYSLRNVGLQGRKLTVIPASSSQALLLTGSQEDIDFARELIARLDTRDTGEPIQRVYQIAHGRAEGIAAVLNDTVVQGQPRPQRGQPTPPPIRITADRDANAIVVSAGPGIHEVVAELLTELDSEDAAAEEITTQVVRLENADAFDLADSLNAALLGETSNWRFRYGAQIAQLADRKLQVVPTGRSTLLLTGAPSDIDFATELITQLDAEEDSAEPVIRTYALQYIQPNRAQGIIDDTVIRGRQSDRDEPPVRINIDDNGRQLIISASLDVHEIVAQLLEQIDVETAAGEEITTRVVRLDNADAYDLADSLNAALLGETSNWRFRYGAQIAQLADRKLQVVPTGRSTLLLTGAPTDIDFATQLISQLDAEQESNEPSIRTYALTHADPEQLEQILNRTVVRGRRRDADEPSIEITADTESGSLVVSASPEVHEIIAGLIDELDTAQAAAQQVTVETVTLENAKAADLAEAINAAAGIDPRRGRSEDQVLVTADAASNSLLLTGRPAEIAETRTLIEQLEATTARVASQTEVFQLRHAEAEQVAQTLREILLEDGGGNNRWRRTPTDTTVRIAAETETNSVVVQGPPDTIVLARQMIDEFDRLGGMDEIVVEIVQLQNAQALSLVDAVNATLQAGQTGRRSQDAPRDQVTVTAEVNSNSVLVRGPAAEVRDVLDLIRRLDSSGGPSAVEVRTYQLENNDATSLAKTLGDLFDNMIRQIPAARNQSRPPFFISVDSRTNTLVVSTTGTYFTMFENLLEEFEQEEAAGTGRVLHRVALVNADPFDVAMTLEDLFIDRTGPDRPIIEADYYSNTLTIIATDVDYRQMQPLLEEMDRTASVEVRVIPASPARASELAATLQRVYPQMSDAPLEVVERIETPNQPSSVPATPAEGGMLEADDTTVELGQTPPPSTQPTTDATTQPVRQPVVIAVDEGTNSLIVSATRQEMDNIESLIYNLTWSLDVAEAELRWFEIENADPVTVAQTLEALYNPQPVQPRPSGGDDENGRRGQPQQQQQPAPKPTITVAADPRTRQVMVRAKPSEFGQIEEIINRLDSSTTVITEVRSFPLTNTDAAEMASNLRELFRMAGAAESGGQRPNQQRADMLRQVVELRTESGSASIDVTTMVSVTANRATNSVVVAAPADAMEVVSGIIHELDQTVDEASTAVVRLYPVQTDDVTSLARTVQEVFINQGRGRGGAVRPSLPVVVTADPAGSVLIVSAGSDDQELIAQVIRDIVDQQIQFGQSVVRVYKVLNTDARSAQRALQEVLVAGGRGQQQNLRISADQPSNSLVIAASEDQQAQIAELLAEIDTAPADAWPIRTITLRNADARAVSQMLSRALQSNTRGAVNSITIEGDPDSGTLVVRADEPTYQQIRQLAMQIDSAAMGQTGQELFALENAQAQSVASMLTAAFRPQRGQSFSPSDLVTVVAEPTSNMIVVNANEQNMEKVRALVTQLDQTGGATTELMVLQSGQAEDLARVLERMAAGLGAGGGRGSARLTVAAEPRSNAIVISGPATDVAKLMDVARSLDVAGGEAQAGVHLLPLENADAAEMASMVQDIYRQEQQAARQTGRTVEPLAVTADERTNTLIFACSADRFQQISAYVNQLEQSTQRRAPLLIQLEHADPTEVQEAIQQLYGGSAQPRTGAAGNVEITVLPGQRQLLVDASPEDFEVIQQLVQRLDQAAAEQRPILRVFQLEFADNQRVAQSLSQTFNRIRRPNRPEDDVTVTALPQSNAVVVAAAEAKMQDVQTLIEALDSEQVTPQTQFKVYVLVNAQPSKVLGQLNSLLQPIRQAQPNNLIEVTVDERTRSIIVSTRGDTTFDQIDRVIEAIDQAPPFESAEVVVMQLRRADAARMADVLNEMLRPSPSGQVTAEARALQEQIRLLRLRPGGDDIPPLDLTQPIRISADPSQSGQQGANALILQSTPDNLAALQSLIRTLDTVPLGEEVRLKLVRLQNADALSVMEVLNDIFEQGREQLAGRPGSSVEGQAEPENLSGRALVRPVSISADLRTNTLVISGSEESLALAEVIINDLEAQTGRFVTQVRLFKLDHADAARMIPVLQAVFAEADSNAAEAEVQGVRAQVTRLQTVLGEGEDEQATMSDLPRSRPALTIQADESTNTIVVAARSDLMPLIADVIRSMDIPGAGSMNTVRFFVLDNADATRIQGVIEDLYTGPNRDLMRDEDRPTVTVDTRTNTLVISASDPTFAMIEQLVAQLDRETPIELRDIRLVTLENAEAITLAPIIQEMMDARVQRQQSLGVADAAALQTIIVADARSNSLIVGGSAESYQIVSDLVAQLDGAAPALGGRIQIIGLTEANAGTLANTLSELFDQRYQAARTADVQRQRPIILPDTRTNSLLVVANNDDSAALQSLVEQLDVRPENPAVALTVIPLQHNDAGVVAPMLEEIFAARLDSMTPQGQQPAPQDEVSITTDALTNALIVAASAENLELIRGLLEQVDIEPPSETGIVRLYPLINSDAQRVATMLQGLIDDGLYKPGLAVADSDVIEAREQVSIAVDTRTNVLIVSASAENFAVIEEIIGRIDSSEDYAFFGGVRVYTLQHADATRLAPTLEEFFDSKRAAEVDAGGSGRALAVTIVSDARTNTLLVAGSLESFNDVERMIEQLDAAQIVSPGEFRVFNLVHASAGALQPMVEELFDQRVERGDEGEPVTIIADVRANALIVGATPTDMAEVEALVAMLDVAQPEPGRAVEVFDLSKADAAAVAQTLEDLYEAQGGPAAAGVSLSVDERTNAIVVTGGRADIERIALLVEQLDRTEVTRVTEIRVFTLDNADATELANLLTETLTTPPEAPVEISPNRQTLLQFIREMPGGERLTSTALQEGLLITPHVRGNALVVVAPSDAMGLLGSLIDALDSVPPRAAEIRTFVLHNADATRMADVLSQLFRLEGGPTDPQAVSYTYRSAEAAGGEETVAATVGSAQQAALTITVDTRTNTLLVGGTRHYVQMAERVIRELDSRPAQERHSMVYRLRNAEAQDIEQAMRDWLDQERQQIVDTLGPDNLGAAQRLLEQDVAIVAVTNSVNSTSNTLLISASPRHFDTIVSLIRELDEPTPQVQVEVMLAEVTLTDSEELGVDWSILGREGSREILAQTNFGAEAGFNSTGFGVSVTGGDLTMFLRALEQQGRLKVLISPQIAIMDSHEGVVSQGQNVPFVTQSRVTDEGTVINTVTREDVITELRVTPRISPDGFVRLTLEPRIESIAESTVQLSETVNATVVNQSSLTTTVTVRDGHSVVIGGLITTTDENRENKVPILGDLPLLGPLFKSTSVSKRRSELLIIVTPRVVRNVNEADVMANDAIRNLQMNHHMQDNEMLEKLFNPLDDVSPDELERIRSGEPIPPGNGPTIIPLTIPAEADEPR